jgi:hypothetical protein
MGESSGALATNDLGTRKMDHQLLLRGRASALARLNLTLDAKGWRAVAGIWIIAVGILGAIGRGAVAETALVILGYALECLAGRRSGGVRAGSSDVDRRSFRDRARGTEKPPSKRYLSRAQSLSQQGG